MNTDNGNYLDVVSYILFIRFPIVAEWFEEEL